MSTSDCVELTLPRSYGQGYRWFGFGGGSHRCRGEMFAYVQIKTIWAFLLRNFDMKLSSELPEPDYTAMVVGPRKPYVCPLQKMCIHIYSYTYLVVFWHMNMKIIIFQMQGAVQAPCALWWRQSEVKLEILS